MSEPVVKSLSVLIKEKATELGFDLCGIAPSRALVERGKILADWCSSGMNGEMSYLARDIEKRINPESLVPDAKSLIVTGLSYYTDKVQLEPGVPVISRYAYGNEYQNVIKKKLFKLLAFIKSIDHDAEGRPFSDTGPLLEKAWACEAGIGWQGKHSIVINKEIGSFFFIGALILNIQLDYDKPYKGENCGNCRLCIEMCPTNAINEDRTIDARKCIANVTIENRGPIPSDIIPKTGGRVYGCDRCQEVCPWNRNAKPHHVPEFELSDEIQGMNAEEWLNLSAERFKRMFSHSPIARKKYGRFMKNVNDILHAGDSERNEVR
jgi:epoxyqueuosine reductase